MGRPPYLAACLAAAAASSAFFAARSAALLFVLGATVGAAVLATAMDSRRLWPGTPSKVARGAPSSDGDVTDEGEALDVVDGLREILGRGAFEATDEGRETLLMELTELLLLREPGDFTAVAPLTVKLSQCETMDPIGG